MGHYFTLVFKKPQSFNGFRFECGGNNDKRGIKQNVFHLKYFDEKTNKWVSWCDYNYTIKHLVLNMEIVNAFLNKTVERILGVPYTKTFTKAPQEREL